MELERVGNSKLIKNLNINGIFQLIHKLGPISRKELAEKTNYSSATISNHVNTLINEGFVIETEKGYSTGGRKPVYLTVNPDKGYIISVEIEVKQIKVVMFNLKFDIVSKIIFPIRENATPNEMIETVFTEIQNLCRAKNLTEDEIIGIGLAVPGLINEELNILEFAPNLGWSNVNLVKLFKDRYNIPVFFENEANAAAIGEREFVYPEHNNIVFVSINEGIGCGIIINGELYKGASRNAGEFGHIIIDPDGPKCHCGNYGCWETKASENYIVNSYKEMKGIKKDIDKVDIYSKAFDGDKEVMEIIKKTGSNIGIGLANIINGLSPELLVIGGGICKLNNIINERMYEAIEADTLNVSLQNVEIKFSKLKNLSTVYGLSYKVFNRIINFN